MFERRALQLSIAIAALLPVAAGLWGIGQGLSGNGWADNHHRYLSGLLLAIGLGYWSTLPRIEAMGARLRLLTALVMIGGGARLVGLVLGDAMTAKVGAALAMELVAAPFVCLWQLRVIATASPRSAGIAKPTPYLSPIVP